MIGAAGVSFSQKEKQVAADNEAQNVAMLELKRAVGAVLTSDVRWDLGILHDVVLSVLLCNDADLFICVALGA